jgi:hypothetical protein
MLLGNQDQHHIEMILSSSAVLAAPYFFQEACAVDMNRPMTDRE